MIRVSYVKRQQAQSGNHHGLTGHDGFTLVELLVAIGIFSVVVTAMITFLFGASSYWQTGQDVADVSESARLGLNRMGRELMQASAVTVADDSQVSFTVDFGDGDETVTYAFSQGDGNTGTVWRSSSQESGHETLMDDVSDITFTYYGSDYRCDSNENGEVTLSELNDCSEDAESLIARVDIDVTIQAGDREERSFSGQAWLRNRSVS